MKTSTAKLLLMEKRQWWESVAEFASEAATADSQSNFNLRRATEKLTAIKRNEKRIAFGEFGRCERCGGVINDERLEAILDNECHYCAACASKSATAHPPQRSVDRSNSHRNYPQPAPQMAYS